MRPRKRILLIGSESMGLNAIRLVLEIWRYSVTSGAAISDADFDAIVLHHPSLDQISISVALASPTPVIAIVRREAERRDVIAVGAHNAVLNNTDLRDVLRASCAKKRGPKPAAKPTQECAA